MDRFFVRAVNTPDVGAEVLDRTTSREVKRSYHKSRSSIASYTTTEYEAVCKTTTIERANFIARALNAQEK